MPARSPDEGDILDRLERCVRQGDWNAAARLKDRLTADNPGVTPEAIAERLRRLQQALIAARVARVNLGVSLSRVRAAARFSDSRKASARQVFAVPADF